MLTITKEITRIDLEAVGEDVMVSMWKDKWQEGSAPFIMEYLSKHTIIRLMMQAEDAGFSCEMCDKEHGRALRGEITRADLIQVSGKWKYSKYPRGWTAKTRPLVEREVSDEEAASILNWCKDNHWQVREFPGGARAWKYEVQPVRDSSTIQRMRRQVVAHFDRGEIDNRRQFDLAFDC